METKKTAPDQSINTARWKRLTWTGCRMAATTLREEDGAVVRELHCWTHKILSKKKKGREKREKREPTLKEKTSQRPDSRRKGNVAQANKSHDDQV